MSIYLHIFKNSSYKNNGLISIVVSFISLSLTMNLFQIFEALAFQSQPKPFILRAHFLKKIYKILSKNIRSHVLVIGKNVI
jgi:hypothetical protein